IEKYLGSGLIRGIGKVMAARLVKAFGLETLDVIENRPHRLTEVGGIGPKRSRDILRAWNEQREIKEVMIFLQSHGVSTHYAIKIFKAYGALATDLVRENPYRLAIDIHGIGFQTADKIAGELGIAKTAPQRIEAGALHLLDEAADRGHLFLPETTLVEAGEKLLAVEPRLVRTAIAALATAEQVIVEPLAADLPDTSDDRAVYAKALHAAEAGVALRLKALLAQAPLPFEIDVERAIDWFERGEKLSLAREQRQAIRSGLTRKLLVITGGPGTGKTTLVRGLV